MPCVYGLHLHITTSEKSYGSGQNMDQQANWPAPYQPKIYTNTSLTVVVNVIFNPGLNGVVVARSVQYFFFFKTDVLYKKFSFGPAEPN